MRESLRAQQSYVKFQSDRPTCVAFAVTAFHEHHVDIVSGSDKLGALDLSEEFLFHHCKKHDGLAVNATGTTLTAASLALARYGQCLEHLHPYRDSSAAKLGDSPSLTALADAKSRMYSGLVSLTIDESSLESRLGSGRPLIAVADWYSNAYLAPSGRIGMPSAAHKLLGRHAILIIEVDDESAVGYQIAFKNSWGTRWGDGGYGSFALEYFRKYCRELWG